MATALAARALAGVRPGHHASCLYRSDAAHRMVLARFTADALARAERVVCAVAAGAESAARSAIRDAGLDVETLIAESQLEVRTLHGDSGEVDPRKAVDRLSREVADARAAGFSGLAFTASATPGPTRAAGDRLVACEKAISSVIAAGNVVVLCRYDARAWPVEALRRAVCAHSLQVDLTARGSIVEYGGLTVSEPESGALAMGGEIDLAVNQYLWARLQEHAAGNGDVVLDVGRVAFIDATGCRVLYRLADSLPPQRRLVLTRATRTLARALALSGWLDHPRIVIDIDSGPRCGRA